MTVAESFSRFAKAAARAMGHPVAFGFAVLLIVLWATTGPVFHFSDTWQLVINTATTVVTFLMVFLIQNTQNRDSAAMQIKLDELLRAVRGAHTGLADLEDMSQEELEEFRTRYAQLAEKARQALDRGKADTDCPELPEARRAAGGRRK